MLERTQVLVDVAEVVVRKYLISGGKGGIPIIMIRYRVMGDNMQTKLHLSFDTGTKEIQFSTEVTDTLYQGGQATIDFRILGKDVMVPIERLVFGYINTM